MSDTIPLTYRELAERLGLSPDSARIKAKRRKWLTVPGNHPSDPVRVLVPVEFLDPERSPERKGGVRTPSAPPINDGEINALRAYVEMLEQRLAVGDKLVDSLRSEHAGERSRLLAEIDRIRADVGRLTNELVLGREGLTDERRRAQDLAAALKAANLEHAVKVDELRTELDRARRSWWRRLVGR
jgi:hypothetical protein